MNKFGVVLGVAAVATLAGCKDPDFPRSGGTAAQNVVKNVETAPVAAPAPVVVEPAPVPKCTCAPGTKHAQPCTCGAPDCKCIVETKPVVTADLSKPAEPEYTIYVVQNGDYLAKISKKFNVTIASIKRLNPSIKDNVVRVGQKLKLPGKIDVGVQSAPVVATVVATTTKKPADSAAKKGFAPYTGATKEYAVQNGDTLGSIAYGNGINIRQLKELNGLTSDSLKIGQKLKVPAEKVVKAEKAKPAEKAKSAEKTKPVEKTKPAEKAEKKVAAAASVAAPVEEKPAENAAAAAETVAPPAEEKKEEPAAASTTYVVQEGDDMTGVSIRWGVSAAQIRELNNLAEGDQLVPGQIIKLPADAQQ